MKNTIKLAGFLAVVCVICALILTSVNNMTEPVIAKNEKEKIELTLRELVPQATKFEEKEIEKHKELLSINQAYNNKKLIATVLEVQATGFQSDIKLLIAITPDDRYDGFKVIDQAETPGYGDVITLDKKYIGQFKTKTVKDPIDTISGSTVTTGAVKKAIETAVNEYKSLE